MYHRVARASEFGYAAATASPGTESLDWDDWALGTVQIRKRHGQVHKTPRATRRRHGHIRKMPRQHSENTAARFGERRSQIRKTRLKTYDHVCLAC